MSLAHARHDEELPSLAGAAQQNRALAASLAEPLQHACDGRLGEINWFRTDWQRGGAATGFSTWRGDVGEQQVVVKLPVNMREYLWMQRLQQSEDDAPPPVPLLFAGGDRINGYDLAWLVIERLPYGPLGKHWHDDHVARIAEAIAAFHRRCKDHPVDREPRQEDWSDLLGRARQAVKDNVLPERQRWTGALKALSHQLDRLVEEWRARTPLEWIHGDLHLANAMSREGDESGSICLIDLAEVRPGHWIEDAVYLERQLWAVPDRLKACRPVRAIGAARKAAGLASGADTARLAALRRLLLASTAPAFMKSEGHPAYLHACLERVEQSLTQLR